MGWDRTGGGGDAPCLSQLLVHGPRFGLLHCHLQPLRLAGTVGVGRIANGAVWLCGDVHLNGHEAQSPLASSPDMREFVE